VRLFPESGASVVESETVYIVMTSLALLVVSVLLTGDVVVEANVLVCNSVTLEVSEVDVEDDVTKLLSASAPAVSSLVLPSFLFAPTGESTQTLATRPVI